MVWTNQPIEVYHGTLESSANSIIGMGGINLGLCRLHSDFGRGFYVTTNLHQAEQWANMKYLGSPAATRANDRAAVLTFSLDRDAVGRLGDHLVFLLPSREFHDFVAYNRLGGSTHARAGGQPYDLVYGPVAAYPQTIVYGNCDQICLLTQNALNALGPPGPRFGVGGPLFP